MRDKADFSVRTVTTVLFIFMCAWLMAAIPAYSFDLQEQAVTFKLKNRVFRVDVEYTPDRTGASIDNTYIRLTRPDNTIIDLTADFPGPNYLPVVDTCRNRFTVAWFQLRENDMQLYYYDSLTRVGKQLPLTGFKTAFPLKTIFYKNTPLLLVFKGNNSDNTDIFYYHIDTGEVRNITATPDSDQLVKVFDEDNRFFVEIESIHYQRRFRVKKKDLSIIKTDEVLKPRLTEPSPSQPVNTVEASRTIVGFGDSITYGTLHLDPDRTINNYHPELCYLFKTEQLLEADYGEMTTINKGVPGDTSFMGLARLETDLQGIEAYYFLTMFGTNDVTRLRFDLDEIIEAIKTIVTTARDDFGMIPVISTIPPQKKMFDGQWLQQFPGRTIDLNAAIIQMATDSNIAYIDSYTAFFNSPDYDWITLLEPYKGNHPGALGHDIMARLFKEKIEEAPPKPPANVGSTRISQTVATVRWDPNAEWDFDHYVVQFGFSPNNLNREIVTTETSYQFAGFHPGSPYTTVIHYRITAVDSAGHASDSPTYSITFD